MRGAGGGGGWSRLNEPHYGKKKGRRLRLEAERGSILCVEIASDTAGLAGATGHTSTLATVMPELRQQQDSTEVHAYRESRPLLPCFPVLGQGGSRKKKVRSVEI